jgi:hypothetical protein
VHADTVGWLFMLQENVQNSTVVRVLLRFQHNAAKSPARPE